MHRKCGDGRLAVQAGSKLGPPPLPPTLRRLPPSTSAKPHASHHPRTTWPKKWSHRRLRGPGNSPKANHSLRHGPKYIASTSPESSLRLLRLRLLLGLIRSPPRKNLRLGDVISVIQFKSTTSTGPRRSPPTRTVRRFISEATVHGHQLDGTDKPLFRALRLERVVTFSHRLIVFVAALNSHLSDHDGHGKTKTSPSSCRGTRKNKSAASSSPRASSSESSAPSSASFSATHLYAGGHYHFIALSAEVYSIDYVPSPTLIDGLIVALVSIGFPSSTIYPHGPPREFCRPKRCGMNSIRA